jgi:hypothetical protein
MPVDIKVNLDLGRAQRSYDQFANKIEKPVRFGGIGGGKGSEPARRSFERGASVGSTPTSDLSEFERGGFYNSLKSKMDALSEAREKAKGEPSARNSLPSPQGLAAEKKFGKVTIETADFKNIKGLGGGKFGIPGTGGGGGGSPDLMDHGDALGNAGQSIPALGALLAVGGALVKLVSSVGEQYTAAMNSQAATLGATGEYIGGGGKYFANADMAQAALAMARERGESVFGRGQTLANTLTRGGDQSWASFAASQGMGIQQVAESYGALTRDFAQNANELSLNTLRQYMKAANVPALKYGETVEKFGKHIQAMRQAGYGGISREGVEQMFSLVAGMKLATPERGGDILQTLDKQARQADQSTLGNILLSKHLASGMSMDEAMMAAERGLGDPKNAAILQEFMKSLDPLSRGFFAKQLGLTYTEGRGLTLESGQKANVEAIQSGGNQALAMQNESMEVMAGMGETAKVAYEMHRAMLDLLQTHKTEINSIAKDMSSIVSNSMDAIKAAENFLNKLADDPRTALRDIISEGVKAAFP